MWYDEKKPDFVNEVGNKWWFDKSSTDYSKSLGLKDISVWLVEFIDKTKSYVIINKNKPIYESNKLEDIGAKLDMFYLDLNVGNKNDD